MSQPVSGTSTATTTTQSATPQDQATIVPKEVTATLSTPDVYGMFVGIFMLFLTVVVLFTTGSILAVLVLWALIALIVTVMFYYGFIDLERILGVKKEVKVEKKPVEPSFIPKGGPIVSSEVFHIKQNQFTYDEAPAVCAAFGTQLATLEQVIEAYNGGAEWCGYGWTAGGMALYPTQKRTWEELQREVDPGKRTACGRPGVNGGYFDPSLKFGVNCFGIKPAGEFTPPAPVPGTDTQKFDDMVNRFREMINTIKLSPFSRNEWSGYDSNLANQAWKAGRNIVERFTTPMSSYGTQFQQDLGKLTETFEDSADPGTVELLETGSGNYSAKGPYGLKGDPGAPGEKGERGPQGERGLTGATGVESPDSILARESATQAQSKVAELESRLRLSQEQLEKGLEMLATATGQAEAAKATAKAAQTRADEAMQKASNALTSSSPEIASASLKQADAARLLAAESNAAAALANANLAESKQNADLLRTQVESIKTKLGELEGRVSTIASNMSELNGSYTTLNQNTNNTIQKVDSLTSDINNFKSATSTEVADLKNTVNPLATTITNLSNTVNALKTNAVQLNVPFRIIDGDNRWLSKSGGGGKGAWEILRAQPV